LIADPDAIQALGPTSIRITLKQPASFFPNLLATPPYFVVSEECYTTNPDAARSCSGIGPYQIIEWQQGETVQLQANPQWTGPGQATFENIQLRFYDDAATLQNAIELGAVDMAWGNVPSAVTDAMVQTPGVRAWDGNPTFKSYLVFQQEDTPWASASLRQAAALAVDREALAQVLSQERRIPLYSPLPDGVPEQVATEPPRDLDRAKELLRLAGYSETNPLVVPLWYLNDGRYSAQEEAYAQALEQQLEGTGMIQVELNGASWDIYSAQMSDCNYATFLLGWPPVGWPTRYPAAMGWLEYFVTGTDSLCSNYESATMSSLIDQARRVDPADTVNRQAIYTQIQELWAQEFPTLDLTQSGPRLIAHESIDHVTFDTMGLLRYGTLTKAPQS
jgi:peptide/nickel transport system substrate-binding protein